MDIKIKYADAQIKAYLMAIEKDDTNNEDFKNKLQAYQDLKEQYYIQKNELKSEGLEQKSYVNTDSRRMKNNTVQYWEHEAVLELVHLDICANNDV